MSNQNCRICNNPLNVTFVDLGSTPLANSYLSADQLQRMEPIYPLRTFVCEECFLVQVEDFETPKHIFGEYAYFSGFSDSWLEHCRKYVHMAIQRLQLHKDSRVIEIASNDGYLLQFFQQEHIPVIGIEPAANVAEAAEKKGISTVVDFFGTALAQKFIDDGIKADLLLGNNVLAHVPQLNDFVAGMKIILSDDGVITMEFPHLMKLMQGCQFDTIYHEHFSYLSFTTVVALFEKHGLKVFDVEQISTHGGSLRIFALHSQSNRFEQSANVERLLSEEEAFGINQISTYHNFSEEVKKLRRGLVSFLIDLKDSGKTIVGYGAPAKGNTLLNYCGLDQDFVDYTVDRSPHKQGLYLPGSRIPIYSPDRIMETKPDYLLILPWNIKEEIIEQTNFIREWGGQWVVPIPEVTVTK
ncbi:methyltransferase domain-containing protein [Cohnella endophytica]|uniref:Methyltransferase domain-containing protein n=1 Tax=Cohnella endophytica TaxID=2419778 RepID=A0A494X933_9BACL|nr:class I SAM-dependent methyltransferase [Cohnella endophytica]RKP47237.1 methyltransferase domain-containing protein [Cohnella endophytica]